ncbi:ATP-dependent sacrificial sulfur transferase LarE [Actinacidiphila paucisporea]|uniref:Asparagine synthetase domain-containing protein n=1 Tax=Actinacidiphila paucisporea TaxID=310782 RepID=A0A1M7NLB1_9ACTN|nr:ATP-dependent sacrificial sulfur transferase LarE [Actinacidiphila paucisporea]SHN04709.1 uncharacterized protein SAMN05216499_11936 [Actinacidiphila paucisporea]
MTTHPIADRLTRRLTAIGPLAVAFSGGADSALVLAAAVRTLGPADVIAVTAVSESLAAAELPAAERFARSLGVLHLTPRTRELDSAGYRANGRDRCYFCKSHVLDAVVRIARQHGHTQCATGTNADDAVDPFRPGIRAADERAVHAPLRDAGLTKADVRELSREWRLPTWDKPAHPCLASRIQYGIEVTGHRLARVDRAETAVRALLDRGGISSRHVRVRDLGEATRVEVDGAAVDALRDLPGVDAAVRSAGFTTQQITVDAFSSGRLNTD